MYGVSKRQVTATEGSRRCRCKWATPIPTSNPKSAPPTDIQTKSAPASTRENEPVTTAATANWYATRPLASFTRLSPSSTAGRRLGTRKISQNGRRGHRVGRRYDGSEHKTGRQRHPRNEPEGRVGNTDDRGKNQPDREGEDRQEVRAKILPRKIPSGREKQRWQENQKDDLRIESALREARETSAIKSPAMTSRIGKGNRTRSATTARMLMIPRSVRRVWIFSTIRPRRMSDASARRSMAVRTSLRKALARRPGAMH